MKDSVNSLLDAWEAGIEQRNREREARASQKLGEEQYQFIPLAVLSAPPGDGPFMHFVNRYWTVHPEKGAAFYNPVSPRTGRRRRHGPGSPQCNSKEEIARMVASSAMDWPYEIRLIESAWVPIDLSDYSS